MFERTLSNWQYWRTTYSDQGHKKTNLGFAGQNFCALSRGWVWCPVEILPTLWEWPIFIRTQPRLKGPMRRNFWIVPKRPYVSPYALCDWIVTSRPAWRETHRAETTSTDQHLKSSLVSLWTYGQCPIIFQPFLYRCLGCSKIIRRSWTCF